MKDISKLGKNPPIHKLIQLLI